MLTPSDLAPLSGARWFGPWVQSAAELAPDVALRRELPAAVNLAVLSSSDLLEPIPDLALVLPAPETPWTPAGVPPRLVALLAAARGRNIGVAEEVDRQRSAAHELKRPLAIYPDLEGGEFDPRLVPKVEYGDLFVMRVAQLHPGEDAEDIAARLRHELDYSPCGRVVLAVTAWTMGTLLPLLAACSAVAVSPSIVGLVWWAEDRALMRAAAPYLARLGAELEAAPPIADLEPLPKLTIGGAPVTS